MSKPQQAQAPAAEETKPKTRALTSGVKVGRAIEKISGLYADYEEALSSFPKNLQQQLDKDIASEIEKLTEQERIQVVAAVNAIRPQPAAEAAE